MALGTVVSTVLGLFLSAAARLVDLGPKGREGVSQPPIPSEQNRVHTR